MQWTVALPLPTLPEEPARSPGFASVEFISETGERHTYTVLALDDTSWAGVNELAWRTLLARARVGLHAELPQPPDAREPPA